MANESVLITKNCPFCNKEQSVLVSLSGYEEWRNGDLIQRVLPELSPSEREILISGVCDSCFP